MKILGLLLILTVGCYSCQQNGPKIIEGKILSKQDSLPIPGAAISELFADSIVQTIWTDSLGNFKLVKQSSGDSLLADQNEPEAFNYFSPVRLRASKAYEVIYLEDAFDTSYHFKMNIRGVVRDKVSKDLLNGVTVETSSHTVEVLNGRFIMGGFAEDTAIVLKSPGYKTLVLPTTTTGKNMSIELELDPDMKKISGQIHQKGGSPLCGIQVLDNASGLTSSTDQQGKFEMFATSAGSLSIADPDAFYKPTKIDVSKLNSNGIELTQASPTRREGLYFKIKGVDGSPLPGVNVVIFESTEGTVSDACGIARFQNIDRDKYVLISFIGFKAKKLKASDIGDAVVLESE